MELWKCFHIYLTLSARRNKLVYYFHQLLLSLVDQVVPAEVAIFPKS